MAYSFWDGERDYWELWGWLALWGLREPALALSLALYHQAFGYLDANLGSLVRIAAAKTHPRRAGMLILTLYRLFVHLFEIVCGFHGTLLEWI